MKPVFFECQMSDKSTLLEGESIVFKILTLIEINKCFPPWLFLFPVHA